MIKTILKYSVLLSILGLVVSSFSCKEIVKYSEEPQINFKSFYATDSVDILGNEIKFVKLTFSIIDGDGDFGLTESDTLPPYDSLFRHNFFSTLYGKVNDSYEEVDILLGSYRIPWAEVIDGKAYKADVDIDFEYFTNLLPYDTLKYEFYVVDKALHESNIEDSPDIIFN